MKIQKETKLKYDKIIDKSLNLSLLAATSEYIQAVWTFKDF